MRGHWSLSRLQRDKRYRVWRAASDGHGDAAGCGSCFNTTARVGRKILHLLRPLPIQCQDSDPACASITKRRASRCPNTRRFQVLASTVSLRPRTAPSPGPEPSYIHNRHDRTAKQDMPLHTPSLTKLSSFCPPELLRNSNNRFAPPSAHILTGHVCHTRSSKAASVSGALRMRRTRVRGCSGGAEEDWSSDGGRRSACGL